MAEPVLDLPSGSAPAYWSAECGGRTYVGSYTLMMDWAQCRDYCTYFPHSAELGYTFSFADILDADTMECLRFNMNNQYTPGNGYAGHYWAGGYRGGDGQYRWDSGAVFEFNDFVGNPGEDPYLHLTPGNKYQLNTKNDQDDRNNGCLCKSEQATSEVQPKVSECPGGWIDLGFSCFHRTELLMIAAEAYERCQVYDAELVSWRDEEEFKVLSYYLQEWAVANHEYCLHSDMGAECNIYWTTANDIKYEGDWVWGNSSNFVDRTYGWREGSPMSDKDHTDNCARLMLNDGKCNEGICLQNTYCTRYGMVPLCQIRK